MLAILSLPSRQRFARNCSLRVTNLVRRPRESGGALRRAEKRISIMDGSAIVARSLSIDARERADESTALSESRRCFFLFFFFHHFMVISIVRAKLIETLNTRAANHHRLTVLLPMQKRRAINLKFYGPTNFDRAGERAGYRCKSMRASLFA